jgi:hypothetical protein
MLRAAPRVPAGINSLAAIYERANSLEKQIDEVATKAPQMRDWRIALPLDSIASGILKTPPSSIGDLAVTLALAASWMGFVTDGIEEKFPQNRVGLAIGTALENAVLFLAAIDDLPVEGEALDLLNRVYADILNVRRASAEAQS